ncbi:MAG: division/cell wall cluster transcriptional repressor MraZ [candidate division Zixibacteria bacterium]|nr:division/cell wall cluster transcriptional repressor MraZ [candidate division Zixibacteria bacterium]
MISFIGRHLVSVDDKGRISIPSKFRGSSEDKKKLKFILTPGLDGCIALYPASTWKEIDNKRRGKMEGLSFTKRDFRFFDRRFYASADDVSPDNQGRIRIPGFLLEDSKITKEALVIGVGDRIELWSPEEYRSYIEGFGETVEQVAERLYSRD